MIVYMRRGGNLPPVRKIRVFALAIDKFVPHTARAADCRPYNDKQSFTIRKVANI